MKKNFKKSFLLMLALTIATFGGVKAYDNSYGKRVGNEDSMLLANVEALTDGEGQTSPTYNIQIITEEVTHEVSITTLDENGEWITITETVTESVTTVVCVQEENGPLPECPE